MTPIGSGDVLIEYRAALARVSICSCGFEAVTTEVGTVYELTPMRERRISWQCGKCRKVQRDVVAWRVRRDGTDWGYLPALLFVATERA